jgi:UDP-N-acetylmuramoyl-L-alanyl-D-glutamate--2,6-diaminopimelate ligase
VDSNPAPLPSWLRDLTDACVVSGIPREAAGITHDSRKVKPGDVFVAMRGATSDGNAFIEAAIKNGAAAVIMREGALPSGLEGAAIVAVPDARAALAEAAAGLYGHPARTLGTVGVTGTDGKTTTTHLIAHVLSVTGRRCGYLSSVEFSDGAHAELNATHMTTVEADEVQRRLAAFRDAGARYAAIEASSIGLDMHRVDQCQFDVGVFTNLAPDHLDYHKTMDLYRDAKGILFEMVGASRDKGFPKAAVLCGDDPASAYYRSRIAVPVVTYGRRDQADITARDITQQGLGTRFVAERAGERYAATTRLLGDYNVANCLAAVAVAVTQGVEFAAAVDALASFAGVPGRMEVIDEGQPFRVIVDIASTEQSMRNVLRTLRPLTAGRLIVAFGAAGERDRERRAGLARAVAETADYAIITNEDPRSEDPDAIIDDIAAALEAAGFESERCVRIPDRRDALRHVFEIAAKGDTVLLAGKGTEQSIVIGTTHHVWDERTVARELLLR